MKKISEASQAATLMDEQKEEQRPWEETPDTPVSVGATTGLSNKPNRETVGVETQAKEEAAGTGEFEQVVEAEEEKEDKEGTEASGMPLPNAIEAMASEEDEVEVVDEDQDIQIVDMSMEEQPHSPEIAGANAKFPSLSPEPTKQGALGYCRDEMY